MKNVLKSLKKGTLRGIEKAACAFAFCVAFGMLSDLLNGEE